MLMNTFWFRLNMLYALPQFDVITSVCILYSTDIRYRASTTAFRGPMMAEKYFCYAMNVCAHVEHVTTLS